MNTKPFNQLRSKMTPEQREMSKACALLMSLHISLIELQESIGIPQENFDKELGINLANISNLENLDDIQISTLCRYIEAQERKFKNSSKLSRKGSCACQILKSNIPDNKVVVYVKSFDVFFLLNSSLASCNVLCDAILLLSSLCSLCLCGKKTI